MDCTVSGCTGLNWTKKLCKYHYDEQRKHLSLKYSSDIYSVWCNMRDRCYNKNSYVYKDYGGRGIKMCNRWRYSFERFVLDMPQRPSGYTIDRTNNDGNYEPGNCRWVTMRTQNLNRKRRA